MRALSLASVVTLLSSAACNTYGASLPPGASAGTFLDAPTLAVPFSEEGRAERSALDASARARIDANVDLFARLYAASLQLRRELVQAERQLTPRILEREALAASDLSRVEVLARRFLELDALLYALWTDYRAHLPYASEPDPFAPLRGANLLSPATRELGGLLALTAEMVRLENAAAVVQVLGPHHAMTRLLNSGEVLPEVPPESYDRCIGALYDPDHRALLERQLRAWIGDRERLAIVPDARMAQLLDVLARSRVARTVVQETDGRRRLRYLWSIVSRSALEATGPAFDLPAEEESD